MLRRSQRFCFIMAWCVLLNRAQQNNQRCEKGVPDAFFSNGLDRRVGAFDFNSDELLCVISGPNL